MSNLNHVGKVISNGRRCLVAYRTLPGDAFSCLIIPTESLQDSYHDSLMKLVESNAAQSSFELADVLYRSTFPDGSNMLVSLHAKGHLVKIPTDKIEMIPNQLTSINLAELNQIIAQNKGVSVQDLAIKSDEQQSANIEEITKPLPEKVPEPVQQLNNVITDEQLAEKYRKDAARLTDEVSRLLEMAEQLVPSKVETAIEQPHTDLIIDAPKAVLKPSVARSNRKKSTKV